jgi:4-aminobutyrate aminotransferase-like enzyme
MLARRFYDSTMERTEQPSRATEKSSEILKAAEALLPGATGFQRPDAPSPTSPMPSIAKAKGAMVTDVDGSLYIDLAGAGQTTPSSSQSTKPLPKGASNKTSPSRRFDWPS